MHSRTAENYIKALYHLGRESKEGPVSLGAVARNLDVTPGTVTQMMKQLAGKNLVTYRTRQGAALTQKGERSALRIIRRHRLIELFLVEVMGMDWADVHAEAEELEHVVSDRLVDRMDEMLGFPSSDPHGSPIPTAKGKMKTLNHRLLSSCSPGTYRLVQVDAGSGDFLAWCKKNGLVPGAEIELVQADLPAETCTLRVGGAAHLSIGIGSADKLRVVEQA
jgi:DtxR family Mn-dependent transcriptional regulator